jgi:GNAT superfamily N-acetyltransferase
VGALTVERATLADVPAVGALRDELATWMLHHGIRQWSPGEMPLDWIEVCVAFGEVYLVSRHHELVGSVTVVWADPLIWGERTEPAGYVHMLMVDRTFAGHGIGRSILEWSEGLVAASGRRLARLDCVEGNQALRAYYEAAGYAFVGTKTFPDLDWADATALYEKRLPPRHR